MWEQYFVAAKLSVLHKCCVTVITWKPEVTRKLSSLKTTWCKMVEKKQDEAAGLKRSWLIKVSICALCETESNEEISHT